MKGRLCRIEAAAVIVAAFILVFVLMARPVMGVADNGDFPRIMGSTGLQYLTDEYSDRYFNHINTEYGVRAVTLLPKEDYVSTEILLVRLAILLNNLVTGNGTFDIRFLSLVYSCIFLVSIWLILRYNRQKSLFAEIVLVITVVFVFADIWYVTYFNSLYGEAVSFIFLLLTTALAAMLAKAERPSLRLLVCFYTAALFLAGAKLQNIPAGIIIILFGIRLLQPGKQPSWKAVSAVSMLLLAIMPVAIYLSLPGEIKSCNKYQAVFYGILKDSPTPVKDLGELGISSDYAVLAGTNFFMKDLPIDLKAPELEENLFNKIDRKKIFLFYTRHPLRYLKKLEITAANALMIRQDGLGNSEKSANSKDEKTIVAKFDLAVKLFGNWSRLKKQLIPRTLPFMAVFYAAYFAVLFVSRRRAGNLHGKLYAEVFAMIGLIGLVQFIVPVLGDGEADLSKHLFLFNACFDIMLAAGIVWISGALVHMGKKWHGRMKTLLL